MKLEEEALIFNRDKEDVFVKKMTVLCNDIDNLVSSYLHPCNERTIIEQKIREVIFWSRYCSDMNVTK